MTNKQTIIALIKSRPGIRTPEIVDETGIENPGNYIVGEIDRGEVLVEKVQSEGVGRPVNAYRINPENPPDETLNPRQRVVKVRGATSGDSAGFSAALSSRGDLRISDGQRTVQLSPEQTSDLIAYLDRINVDQVMKAAGVA
ncbi:hypothetical protein [Cupriavidus gilardii]|uniref:Uncharacterized protein n=1 Tax=Cupriavidus gilardii TaxID=82541 RepID=A0ABY4VTL1_9BURK|nr:hypothetical protein [Cupriavidus gilardii]NSX04831.1 hypothetical protein [Cupriavidus gilardii]USE78090.1 hypothetical protein NDR89_03315 [Cupriavidus gilardii]